MDGPGDDQDAAPQYTRQPTLDDLIELCRLLNREGAGYAILGGMAVNFYGLPRATHDIDLLVDDAPEITVDLLARAVDVTYADAAPRIVLDRRYGEPIPFLALADLIRSKSTYRDKDRQDQRFLESLL